MLIDAIDIKFIDPIPGIIRYAVCKSIQQGQGLERETFNFERVLRTQIINGIREDGVDVDRIPNFVS